MKKKSVAVVIISNGPGELTTWVNPVVDELNKINESLRNEDKQNFFRDQRTFFTIQPRTLYMYKYLFYAIEKYS